MSHHHDHDDHQHCDHHHHDVVYNKVVKANHKVASVLLRNAKTIELTFDQRQEIPHNVPTTDGAEIICHIEEPVEVGDKLVSNTNEWALVAAAPETLFHIARGQAGYEAFLHVAGLEMWPVELTDTGLHVVASHECMHMLEHFELQFTQLEAPMHELVPPELAHNCCDHDHDHEHNHSDHEHGPDCGHHHH
jgi:urease accessory protein